MRSILPTLFSIPCPRLIFSTCYPFISDPIYCPALLPTEVAYKLRERLCWQPSDSPYTLELTEEHGFTTKQLERVTDVLSMADPSLLACLKAPPFGTAQRCLLVARLFGDSNEVDFWTVALYFLQVYRAKLSGEA